MPPDCELSLQEIVALRYVEHAFGRNGTFPWRVAAKLAKTKLFEFDHKDELSDNAKFVVQQISEIGLSPFYLEPDTQERRAALYETTDFLGTTRLAEINAIGLPIALHAAETTKSQRVNSLVERYNSAVSAANLPEILSAASDLDLTLESNWAWQLHLLVTAIQLGAPTVADRQLRRLLSIDVGERNFVDQMQSWFDNALRDVSTPLDDIPAASTLYDFANAYAHLPWKPTPAIDSVGSLIDKASTRDRAQAFLADCLECNMPGMWFSVWLLVMRSEGMPRSIVDRAWERIGHLLNPQKAAGSSRFLSRYFELTQYFFFRLETSHPLLRHDALLWSASYLAQSLANAMREVDSKESGSFEEAVHRARVVWQIGGQFSPYSSLRAAFLTFQSIWPPAIQASLEHLPAEFAVPDQFKTAIGDVVRKTGATMLCPEDEDSAIVSDMAFEQLTELHTGWADLLGDSSIDDFATASRKISVQYLNSDCIVERMKRPFGKGENVDDVVALHQWMNAVIRGRVSIDVAVDTICSDYWSEIIEPTLEDNELELVLTAFMASSWAGGRESIRAELSHWAARQCIKRIEHENRRNIYFWMTGLYSLKSGTFSGLQRLFAEDDQNLLENLRVQLLSFLSTTYEHAPPLIQGRVRTLLAIVAEP